MWPLALAIGVASSGCLSTPADPAAPTPDPQPAGPRVLLAEGAEEPSNWTARTFLASGADNRPDAGAWHPTTQEARSGAKSWTFQDESVGRYHDSATYDLHAPTIDLSTAAHPLARFHYRGESEAQSGDEFSWGFLSRGNLVVLGSTDAAAPEWTEVVLDLAPYKGGPFDLMFRFEADYCGGDTLLAPTCGEGSFAGYFLDDIEIWAE